MLCARTRTKASYRSSGTIVGPCRYQHQHIKFLRRVPKHGTTKDPAEENGHSTLAPNARVRNVDGAPKLDAVLSFFRLSPTSGSGELFVGAGFFFVSGSSSTASRTTSACASSHMYRVQRTQGGASLRFFRRGLGGSKDGNGYGRAIPYPFPYS
jgi:hypothetical protein